MSNNTSLSSLGWQPFFQQQLNLEEWNTAVPARITSYHKTQYEVATELGDRILPITQSTPALAVGDWILLTPEGRFSRLLDRTSCFRRKAAGSKVAEQLIAANVDVAFIVCSLNEDFNLNRIERYLSMVYDAGAKPIVVLSKMDLCIDSDALRDQVQRLDNGLCIELVNCLDEDSTSVLLSWCEPGKTVVVLGSSGAGKSTLANTLLGEPVQVTGDIREDDSKGRHTTTQRALIKMPNGAMILDTPGMRELQLASCEKGVAAAFSDIEALSETCRFGDCAHDGEPGCSVIGAIESGQLDERRLINYHKLRREQSLNAASLAERRADDRKLTRYYSRTQRESKKLKRDL